MNIPFKNISFSLIFFLSFSNAQPHIDPHLKTSDKSDRFVNKYEFDNINQRIKSNKDDINQLEEFEENIEKKIELLSNSYNQTEINKEYFGHILMVYTGIIAFLGILISIIGGYLIPKKARKNYKSKISELTTKYNKLTIDSLFERYKLNISISYIAFNLDFKVTALIFRFKGLIILYGKAMSEHFSVKQIEERYKKQIVSNLEKLRKDVALLTKPDLTADNSKPFDDGNRLINELISLIKNEKYLKDLNEVSKTFNEIYYK